MSTHLHAQLASGDSRERDRLRREVFPRIVALCERLLGSRAAALDEAEDLWTDFLVTHAGKLRSDAALVAYLRIMAIRRCRRRNELLQRQGAFVDLASEEEGPESSLILRDEDLRQQQRLEECLRQLDTRARQIVRMKFHFGMTQETIGEELGFSKQYAGRVLSKALEGLRRCIEVAR
jgi:RNA polymerase sigma factor (sigma-70 family)